MKQDLRKDTRQDLPQATQLAVNELIAMVMSCADAKIEKDSLLFDAESRELIHISVRTGMRLALVHCIGSRDEEPHAFLRLIEWAKYEYDDMAKIFSPSDDESES